MLGTHHCLVLFYIELMIIIPPKIKDNVKQEWYSLRERVISWFICVTAPSFASSVFGVALIFTLTEF